MQKFVRTAALVLVTFAIPAVSFAREPMGTNPRPQGSMTAAGEPMGTNPRPQATAIVLNNLLPAVSVLTGR